MGRYNLFIAEGTCPHCHHSTVFHFQADIGRLEWTTFELGDDIMSPPATMGSPVFGPDPDALHSGRDLWAAGLERCPSCHLYVHARINIRSGKYHSCEITSSSNELYEWGFL